MQVLSRDMKHLARKTLQSIKAGVSDLREKRPLYKIVGFMRKWARVNLPKKRALISWQFDRWWCPVDKPPQIFGSCCEQQPTL